MSSYNYNVQISLAGSNSVSQEQEKTKNATKKHQEDANAVMRKSAEAHNKVSAVPDDEVSYQVHNEKEHANSESSIAKNKKKQAKKDKTHDDVLADNTKGTKVNVVC